MEKLKGKVREFCQSGKVGTLCILRFVEIGQDIKLKTRLQFVEKVGGIQPACLPIFHGRCTKGAIKLTIILRRLPT